MASFYEFYHQLMYTNADSRIVYRPLMGSPLPLLTILVVYWWMIKQGPKLMANRPAYNITAYIKIYNLVQVAICASSSLRVFYMLSQRSIRCLTHRTNSNYDLELVFFTWVYCMLKVLDLCDTLFFVLRKKFALLTTLHTYHHTMMLISSFVIARYVPAGELSIVGMTNCFVHSIMYFYYFYCLHTESRANVWWKKHITQLQLMQFGFFLGFYTWKLLAPGCDAPKWNMLFCLLQSAVMVFMFSNYYYKAFVRPKQAQCANNNGDIFKKAM